MNKENELLQLLQELTLGLSKVKEELSILRAAQVTYDTSLTYGEWLLTWLETYKKPKVKYNYYLNLVGYVRNYVVPVFGSKPLVSINSMELQEFLLRINMPATRTQVAAVISASLRKAFELRLIPFNPYLAVSFEHYEQPTLGALTHRQYVDVLNAIDVPKRYVQTWLLLATGLRQGECLALERRNVDLERKTIRVEKSLERGTLELVKPKTRAGVRTVPIEEPLIGMLAPYLDTPGRIFPENTPDSLSRYYRRLFARLNLPFSGHIFRHTFITNAYELEIPDYVVQRWCGHSKRAQADVYLALRNAGEFEETELVRYMLRLKSRAVPSILRT